MQPLIEGLENRQLLAAGGFSLKVRSAGPFYTGQPAYFDAWVTHPLYRSLDKFTAVRWGDGTPAQSGGTVPLFMTLTTDALASHVYEHPGVYRVRETIFSTGKIVEQFSRKVYVFQHSPGGVTLQGTTAHALTAVFASIQLSFSFTNATVEFGDGMQAPAFVTSIGNNRYQVTASHRYAKPGVYHASILANVLPTIPYAPRIPGGSSAGAVDVYSTVKVAGRKVTPNSPKVQLTSIAPAAIYQDHDVALASVTGVPTGLYVQPYALITWNKGQTSRAELLIDENGNGTIITTPDETMTGIQNYSISVFLNDHADSKQNTQLGTIQAGVTVDPNTAP